MERDLGLPLGKAIVALHRGQIVIDGKPGCGTTVTVSLLPTAAQLARRHDQHLSGMESV